MMQRNKKIKVSFNNDLELIYHLHNSALANIWIEKIKHLQNVALDPVESDHEDFSNIHSIYNEFCRFADIDPVDISTLDQGKLNQRHKIYEDKHKTLSTKQDNSGLYRFHRAIHVYESGMNASKIRAGWGKYEGLLTTEFQCNKFYEDKIIRNNIYLPWAELGKKPQTYWENKEPDDQERFNTLAKPHTTFRAQFIIATSNINPRPLENNFIKWFTKYKEEWLNFHNITKWDHIDEYSAPLLAETDYNGDLVGLKVKKIRLC